MAENGVTFKATVNGLIIVMKEEDDFETTVLQIDRKLESSGRFFKGASLAVKYRGKKLTPDEEKKIVDLMEEKTGAQIQSFEEYTEEPLAQQTVKPAQSKSKMKKHMYFKGVDEGEAKFYRGTVRSGQLVKSEGNLVVIGDVNPGGEVCAAGNVVVMGSLRGIVHAGSDGNSEAVVVALNLQPMQLRIAGIITRSPDERETRNSFVPELAYVKDNLVYIERFLPQR